MDRFVLAEPMSFAELVNKSNLFLFSAEAAAVDYALFPNEPLPESDEDEGGASLPRRSVDCASVLPPIVPLEATPSTSAKLELLFEVKRERDALREENLFLRVEVALLKEQLEKN